MPDSAFVRLKRKRDSGGHTPGKSKEQPAKKRGPAGEVLDMQRRYGNRAVQQMIGPTGQKGDPQERFQSGDFVAARHSQLEPEKIMRQADQIWNGKNHSFSAKDVETGVATTDVKLAHPQGNNTAETDMREGSDATIDIYRTRDTHLAKQAGEVAKSWQKVADDADKLMKTARGKAFRTIFSLSKFSKSKAMALAHYATRGITVDKMVSREFAITVYQLTAVKHVLAELKQKMPSMDAEEKKQKKRQALTKWVRANQGRADALKNVLGFDPRRVPPEKLIAELHRLGANKDPQWKFIGPYTGRS